MPPAFRETLSRIAARVVGSPVAKPVARVALAGAGLVLLAIIGRSAVAGAGAAPAAFPSPAVLSIQAGPSTQSPSAASEATPASATAAAAPPGPAPSQTSSSQAASSRSQASPEDPVILNTATADDLRRLPGVGEKRAMLILALRTQLGRFRAVEDLLKVKGIGRATLKRLRPLVRLDAPPSPPPPGATARPADAGSAAPR
jgi:competence protein ComEA